MTKDEAFADDPDLVVWDGFDDAIVGIAERCGMDTVVVYDTDKMVQVLIERDGMDEEEAREFLSFNTWGAYVGPKTPLHLHRFDDGL